MSNKIFTSMEMDAIGEIMNISLGSSATAVSNMLDHRVDITTPQVSVVNAEDFTLGELEPAVGVEIKYVTGLEGSNIMLLKMSDVKAIVDILMGMETPEDEFELNDLTLSAVCEVMNQMMGAAATALSDFLGRMVNISTPQTFDGNDIEMMRRDRLPVSEGPIVVVQFALSIEGMMKSEFMNVISVGLARELVAGFGLEVSEIEEEPASAPEPSGDGMMSQEEIEKLMGGAAAAAPAPEPSSGGVMSQEEIEKLMGGAAAPAADSSGSKMSQEEIEALMMGGAAAAPAASPSQGQKMSQEEIEAMMSGTAKAPAQPASPAAPQMMPQAQGAPTMSQQMPQGQGFYPPYMMYPQGWSQEGMPAGYPSYYMPPPGWQQPESPAQDRPKAKSRPDPKVISTKPVSMPNLENETELDKEQAQNLDLIMNVPLEIAVEIGRTQKKVQDILSFSKGSLVVLDKLAGDQVDLYVNGKCIAHGDVVVIDDNFGIRINEILRKPELGNIT